jgi:hypothetical protein
MKFFDPEKHIAFFENPYDTDKTKFNFPVTQSIQGKTVYIFCSSLLFHSQMTPSEYAQIVYDMYAFYFIHRYKRLTKALFDETKKQLDYDFINSFEFPALFENQKYTLDESSVEVNPTYDKDSRQWIGEFTFVPKNEYLKVFGK